MRHIELAGELLAMTGYHMSGTKIWCSGCSEHRDRRLTIEFHWVYPVLRPAHLIDGIWIHKSGLDRLHLTRDEPVLGHVQSEPRSSPNAPF